MIESETMAILNENSDTDQTEIVITISEFDEIFKKSRKPCPRPDEIGYKLLKIYRKNVKALTCLRIGNSINNSYVPLNWREPQITMIPEQGQDRSKAENYRPIQIA